MSTPQTNGGRVENCEDCDAATPHAVGIELLTESDRERNAEFSREPYRVATCRYCGGESRRRMNNA